MKLQVKSDRYQYILHSGKDVIGHYATVLTLLEGARNHIRKQRTKAGIELRALIESGIAHEAKTLEQLKALAAEAAQGPR